MGARTTLVPKSAGRDRTAQLASDTSLTRSGAFAPAVNGRPRPLALPSVTHESAAGGQGGSSQVQCRQSQIKLRLSGETTSTPPHFRAAKSTNLLYDQRQRRPVGSTASAPRQGSAALAPGPKGARTTLESKSAGRDLTAQLASDTSSTRSGAFAPAVDGRPRPLDCRQ